MRRIWKDLALSGDGPNEWQLEVGWQIYNELLDTEERVVHLLVRR